MRKVNGWLVFIDDKLGGGQYGQVVKAQLESEVKQKIRKYYACKIIDIVGISNDDMECIEKEVSLHSLVKSQYSVCLHKTIKTSSNVYMMQEFCNGYDLGALIAVRKRIT